MNIINVTVREKIARAEERARVVCGNSDYAVRFDFDEEWSAESVKTARFTTDNGTYTDVQFEGDTCTVPILANTRTLQVGVYAGNLRTTTAALIHALPCVTDPDGTPADPAPDVYNQLMDRLNDLETIDPAEIDKAVKDYLTEHPIEETDPTVPAWAKQPQKPTYTAAEVGAATEADVTAAVTQAAAKLGPMFDDKQDKLDITNATAGQIPQITAVDASGTPTAWGAVDLPSGGGEWALIRNLTLEEQSDRVDITTDEHGNTFSLSECYCSISTQSYEDSESEVFFLPNGGWSLADPTITSSVKSSKSSATWKNDAVFHAIAGGAAIISEQLPARASNNMLSANAKLNQSKITKLSFAGKFGAGCSFWIIGR